MKTSLIALLLILSQSIASFGFAQEEPIFIEDSSTTPSVLSLEDDTASESALETPTILNPGSSNNIERLRETEEFSLVNILPNTLFDVIDRGLPAETVILILMLPLLTTLIVFTRNIVGIPSLDMLVIIAFSIALFASNLIVGLLILITTVFSAMFARIVFKKAKIMQLPKISLSMMIVSVAVLILLSLLAYLDMVSVENISIVPVLLIIILSERIVRLEFERKPRQVWTVVIASLFIGLAGYYILLSEEARTIILNFPELILLLIPINFIMGRYFGLRFTEHYRFGQLSSSKKIRKTKS